MIIRVEVLSEKREVVEIREFDTGAMITLNQQWMNARNWLWRIARVFDRRARRTAI